MNLSELPIGKKATISYPDSDSSLIPRLIDMGTTPTSIITCLFKSFSGGMRAYSIDENIFALRQKDASRINILCKEVL